jgi:hypothetical protein
MKPSIIITAMLLIASPIGGNAGAQDTVASTQDTGSYARIADPNAPVACTDTFISIEHGHIYRDGDLTKLHYYFYGMQVSEARFNELVRLESMLE